MTILLYELVGSDPSRPFSPHCWKAAMALAHKGLPFERLPVSFTGVPAIEGGAYKTVPVISDDGRIVADSFEIARYLEETYPDRPSLFGGSGGQASVRFVERWSQLTIHPYLGAAAMLDIHDGLAPSDQAYFRESRERRNNGRSLESVASERDARHPEFLKKMEPLRGTLSYQPFIGGQSPLFSDYIVFGAFQWVRVMSSYPFLSADDPITSWFERCLDLHDGLGRRVPPAA